MAGESESNGFFLDGETPTPAPMRISLLDTSLRFVPIGSHKTQSWDFTAIDWEHSRNLNGQLRLKLKDEDRWLVATSSTLVAEIEAERRHWLKRHFWAARPDARMALHVCLAAVIICGGLWLGWPLLTKPLAAAVPSSTRDRLADMAQNMVGMNNICHSAAGDDALRRLTERLTIKRTDLSRIGIVAVRSPMVNALTLANDRILLTSAIIDRAKSPDEIAGILAHEFGHVAHRHVLRGFLGQATMSLLIGIFSGAHGTEMNYANRLIGSAHTRAFEAEADTTGIELLRDGHIASQGLAEFFQRLARREGSGASFTKYFSTHPLSAAREKLMRETVIADATPAMNYKDWQAVKSMCDTARSEEKEEEPSNTPPEPEETAPRQEPDMPPPAPGDPDEPRDL